VASDDIFESSVRSTGDLAGVFEYDGDNSYFYLYDTDRSQGEKVLDSIHVLSGKPDFSQAEIAIRWDDEETKVGLFIRGQLWAVFDSRRRIKYGGRYSSRTPPSLPSEVMDGFPSGTKAGRAT